MKKTKDTFRATSMISVIIGATILIAAISIGLMKMSGSEPEKVLALQDTAVSRQQLQLCSPYAKLCFTRPSSWKRSTILHIRGSANNTVEINPPSGTIVEFAKAGRATNVHCDSRTYARCLYKKSALRSLANGASVVSGMLIDSPDANCQERCASPKYIPFVQLVSASNIQKYHLNSDTAPYTDFNPSATIYGGQAVFFQVTPGKVYDYSSAQAWLKSPEAKTTQQILSTAKEYKDHAS